MMFCPIILGLVGGSKQISSVPVQEVGGIGNVIGLVYSLVENITRMC